MCLFSLQTDDQDDAYGDLCFEGHVFVCRPAQTITGYFPPESMKSHGRSLQQLTSGLAEREGDTRRLKTLSAQGE